MTRKIELKLEDQEYRRIREFKKVFDVIMNGETAEDDYYRMMMGQGLKSMQKDVVPNDRDDLWRLFRDMSEDNPEYICSYLARLLKDESEEVDDELQEKAKSYIW